MEPRVASKKYDHTVNIFDKLLNKRIIFLEGDIDSKMATKFVANLYLLELESSEEITICINSPGGFIDGMFTIYDAIQYCSSSIRTICIGQAESGGAIILAAGTNGRRFVYPHAKIMIHSIQLSELAGSQIEIAEEIKKSKNDNSAMMKILAKHTGKSVRKITNDCKDDKYFTANEAIKYGLADKIMNGICGV